MKRGVGFSLILIFMAIFSFGFFANINQKTSYAIGPTWQEFEEQFKELIKDDDYSKIFIENDISAQGLVNALTNNSESSNIKIANVITTATTPVAFAQNAELTPNNIQRICSNLNYVVEEVDGGYQVYSEYKFKRIIVLGNVKETYGAKVILTYNNYNILSYETEEQTKYAYEQLSKNEDLITSLVSLVETADYDYSSYVNQWGAAAIDLGYYNDYLVTNNSGEEVVVAVLDTGINTSHTMLKDRILKDGSGNLVGYTGINSTYSGYAFEDDGWSDTNNDGVVDSPSGHGSHVSGIIAGLTPSNVKILPMKVLGHDGGGSSDLTTTALLALYEDSTFSAYNIVCANLSLGAKYNDISYANTANSIYNNLFTKLRDKNIISVVAAGNDAVDAIYCAPAGCSVGITVGAVYGPTQYSEDPNDKNQTYNNTYYFDTKYSNYGSAVNIVAPGTWIASASIGYSTNTGTDKYLWMVGTSQAAPHVSAIAALLCLDESYVVDGELDYDLDSIEQRMYNSATTFNKNGAELANCKGLANLKNHISEIKYTATDSVVSYDGKFHNINVAVDYYVKNYTIKYGLVEGEYNITDITTDEIFKNYTEKRAVYFKISSSGYITTYGVAYLTINKAELAYTISDQIATYGLASLGQGNSYYTKTSGTIYNSDNLGIVLTTTATNTSPVGEYEISATYTNTNYNITFTSGKLVINPKSITISLNDQSGYYGDAPSLSGTAYALVTENGIVNNDSLNLSLTTTATNTSNIGRYKITLDTYNTNYTITVNNVAYYVVQARAITIAYNATGVYGNSPNLLASECTITNVVSGHNYETIGLTLTTTATNTSAVGTYPITFNCSNINYAISNSSVGSYTIFKRDATIRAIEQSFTYGDEISLIQGNNIAYEITSGSVLSSLTITANLTTEITSASNVGTYTDVIELICSDTTNYNLTLSTGNVKILARPITITANDANVMYGNTLDLATCSYSISSGSLANSDTLNVALVTSYTTQNVVGDSPAINIGSISGGDNYYITTESGKVNISPREITVQIGNQIVAYNTEFTLSAVYTVVSENKVVNDDDLLITLSTVAEKSSPVGDYEITATSANKNYSITFLNGTLTISEGVVIIAVDNQTFQYGSVNLDLTKFSVSPADVDVDSLGVTLVCLATNASPVGEYEISATVTNTNYSFSVNVGKLIITQRELHIALENQVCTYGDVSLDNSKYEIQGGIVNSDTVEISLITDADYSSVVGSSYTINATTTNGNYKLIYTEANLTIVKRDITITLINQSGIYGDDHASNLNQGSYTLSEALISGNDLNIELSTNATATDIVGNYQISFTYSNNNYNITNSTETATFRIDKRPITIKANNLVVVFGNAIDSKDFTYTLLGQLVNSDRLNVTFKTDYVQGTPVGSTCYLEIDNVIGDKVANYSITKEKGNIHIVYQTLKISADDKQVTYGNKIILTDYTITTGEILPGDDVNISIKCEVDRTTPVGIYAIKVEVTGKDVANYDIQTVDGRLEVMKREITVTLHNQESYYGNIALSNIAYTVTNGKVVNADDLNITVKTNATNASPVGSYNLNAECGNQNYLVTFVQATLEVKAVDLIITVFDQEGVYGNVTLNQTKFEVNLAVDVNSLGVTLVSEGDSQSNVGQYEITANYTTKNYTIGVVKGVLTIKPKELSIKISDQSCEYGNIELDNSAYQITSGELIPGDSLDLQLMVSATNTTKANTMCDIKVDTYNQNYKFTSVINGILRILPRRLVISSIQTITYGNKIILNNSDYFVVENEIANGDDLDLKFTCYDAGSVPDVGEYVMNVECGNENYIIDLDDSNLKLIIEKRNITIKANLTTTYGNAIDFNNLNYQIIEGSAVNNDNLNITFTTNASNGDNVGDYELSLVSYNSNYNISLDTESCFKITPREIEINILQYGTYGDAIVLRNDSYEIVYGTLANETDNLDLILSSNITSTSNAGEYSIQVVCGNANYSVKTGVALFVLQPRNIHVTIANASIVYGNKIELNNKNYTLTSGDVVAGDNLNITLKTEATNISNAGDYAIEGRCANPNYNVNFTNGVLTINKRQVKIALFNQETKRGFAFEIDQNAYKILEGEILNPEDFAIEIYSEASKHSFGGSYALMAKSKNPNYELSYNGAEIRVKISVFDIILIVVGILAVPVVAIIISVVKKVKKNKQNKELFNKWIGW